MQILDRSVYVGPRCTRTFPSCASNSTGPLEAWPTGRLGHEFVDALAAALPGLGRTRLLLRRAGRIRSAHDRRRGHLARARAGARGDRTAEHRRRGGHLRQDARAGAPGVYTRRLRVRAARRGHRRGRSRVRLLCSLLPAAIRPAGSRPDRTGTGRGARRVHPLRAAPRARAVHRLARARRRGARHPLAAPQRPVLVQLGHGKYQQRIQATVTSRTSHIAVEIASDKEETNQILATLGLPVPQAGAGADRRRRRCAPRERIGFPVVIKPSTATTAAASRSA